METNEQASGRRRRRRGGGTQRERRPGVWEVRVPTGEQVGGQARQRSYIVHGSAADAAALQARLVATPAVPAPAVITVGELLGLWLAADQPWKPSTLVGYTSVVRSLRRDRLAGVRVAALTPLLLRETLHRWSLEGVSEAVAGARFRVLRSAVGWGWTERLLDVHPIRATRGPARPDPRRPLTDQQVQAVLAAAEIALLEAHANHTGSTGTARRLHRAEQDLLLVRLAADTGARRGELAALKLGDLTGRSLTIARGLSAGQVTTPKSGRARALTVGASTADLWHTLTERWADRVAPDPLGPWLFSPHPDHHTRLGADVLDHRFTRIRDTAGVPDATLHRLRHSVATFLVARGQILHAQHRLGHADAATTLREYAHALPGTDTAIADAIDTHLHGPAQTIWPAPDRDGPSCG